MGAWGGWWSVVEERCCGVVCGQLRGALSPVTHPSGGGEGAGARALEQAQRWRWGVRQEHRWWNKVA